MEIEAAKQWVYQYFGKTLGGMVADDPDELYAVVDVLCGCQEPLPRRLQQEYKGARTYHDLWREVQTDHIIEDRDDPHQWLPDLYHIYIRDQEVRGQSPSKAGFRVWLNKMIGDDEACDEAMEQWTADMVQ
jgi:hypothetical protein